MKKQYVQPELNILLFEIQDIITVSYATGGGDASTPFNSDWIPTDSDVPSKGPFRP